MLAHLLQSRQLLWWLAVAIPGQTLMYKLIARAVDAGCHVLTQINPAVSSEFQVCIVDAHFQMLVSDLCFYIISFSVRKRR